MKADLDLPLPSSFFHRRSFRPAGKVLSAEYMPSSPKFARSGTTSKAQRLGKRYESKIIREIKKLDIDGFIYSPWISFMAANGALRSCQPDILLLDSKLRRGIIFEVKYSHTIDAYFQLKQLYLPVVNKLHPEYDFTLVELTRSYDGAVKFPEEISGLYFDIKDCILHMQKEEISALGVLQWKL